MNYYAHTAKGMTLSRALPVWSERLGLNGKCDIVEIGPTDSRSAFDIQHSAFVRPVEFKLGKRRREVEFTAGLRARTETAAHELHGLLRQSEISNLRFAIPPLPPAVFKPACEEGSLYEICLPKATAEDSRAARLGR